MIGQFFRVFLALGVGTAAQAIELTTSQDEDLMRAEIVILGEIHDNPAHHLGQAALIRRVEPKAVVFEMLTPEMAHVANTTDRTDLADLGVAVGWTEAGWPDFALYAPVFEALGDAPTVGAATPRERVRAAFQQGAAFVFGPGAERFGLDQPLPEDEQVRRETLQFEAHCAAMPLAMMGGMVEAQRLRDAQFSDTALRALETFGPPVVVITGNGHARLDWGMPAMIKRAAPQVRVLSIGFVEDPEREDTGRYDITYVTDGVDREDPCAAFKTE